MKDRLDDLTDIIKKVYLPLMQNRQDQRLQMDQFVRNVHNSMEQAYGNITIDVPPLPDKSEAELQNDPALIEELISTVVSTAHPSFSLSSRATSLPRAEGHLALCLYLCGFRFFGSALIDPPFLNLAAFGQISNFKISRITNKTRYRLIQIYEYIHSNMCGSQERI